MVERQVLRSKNNINIIEIMKSKKGSALILTMFILMGMLIVAMSSSYIILVGIRAGGVQSQSTKAYFTAEAGAEDLLWEMRHNLYSYPSFPSDTDVLFSKTMPLSGANYKVYFSNFPPLIFTSVGDFNNTKRSVEIEFRN
ncbi:MAG: hypothetical protein ACYC40_02420 [Patescibacteria group bacterium]